ncbi:MAG: hypothetical protein KatS3mg105_4382 [Gemmatales bacterium]|nr:MAG: hypothetical protein KatS3mg105_4382 [Gemmatales bacterium]
MTNPPPLQPVDQAGGEVEQHAAVASRLPPAGRRFPCKQCGARLEFDPALRALKCPYCNAVETIDPSDKRVQEYDWHAYLKNQAADKITLTGRSCETKCPGCGAVVLLEDKIVTETCPYCASFLTNKPVAAESMIKPQAILPFAVTRREAVAAFQKWIASRWFAPSTLKKLANIGQLFGIYVPFWTYDSMTYTYYCGQRGDDYTETETYTTTNAQGQTETHTRTVTKTRWTWVSGEVDHFFDDVLVCASKSLPESHVSQLEPWDLQNLEGFREEFLSGFQSERYAIDLEEGFDRAKEIMEAEIRDLCRRDIGGDHQRLHTVQTQYVGVTFKHLLLPIWVAPYRFGKRSYQILVNARTGEVVGSRPYSWVKIIGFILMVAVVVAMLVGLFLLFQEGTFGWIVSPALGCEEPRQLINVGDAQESLSALTNNCEIITPWWSLGV